MSPDSPTCDPFDGSTHLSIFQSDFLIVSNEPIYVVFFLKIGLMASSAYIAIFGCKTDDTEMSGYAPHKWFRKKSRFQGIPA
jgi:hypothetical protein